MAIEVATLADLHAVRNDLAGEYIQTANIDASPTSDPLSAYYNAGAGWEPIGTAAAPFTGSYDGGGFTVDGLTIVSGDLIGAGLFGTVSGGTLSNVAVTNANVTGQQRVGLVTGEAIGSSLNGCWSSGLVHSAQSSTVRIGGVAGSLQDLTTAIGCHSSATVTCPNGERVGGCFGQLWSSAVALKCTVTDSYATGNVHGERYAGGFVGQIVYGVLHRCYATGYSLADWAYSGGLAGVVSNSSSINDSYAQGAAQSDNYTGGLVGSLSSSTITNCYSTGVVTGGLNRGGLVGGASLATATACYWDTQTSGRSTSARGTGKTTAQMQDIATYAAWDIDAWVDVDLEDPSIWVIEPSSYPVLFNEDDFPEGIIRGGGVSVAVAVTTPAIGFVPTASPSRQAVPGLPARMEMPPVEVATFSDLEAIRNNLYGNYVQTADIDASITQEPSYNDGKGWQPIGGEQLFPYAFLEFKGVYDGQGYEISGLTINDIVDGGTLYMGLFGAIFQAEISDVHLVDLEINGTEDTHYIGGIAGRVGESTIEGCSVTGSITGGSCIAGIAGARVWSSTISRCEANIQILGYAGSYGGIIGELLENNTITKCYSQGSIATTATDWEGGWIGGLIGYALGWGPENPIVIEDCGTIASVVGASESGGLIGYCMASGDDVINIRRCYAAGSVNVIDSGPAGLTNFFGGEGEIVDCFWDVETTGQSTSAGGTGKSTAEMKKIDTFTNTDNPGLIHAWEMQHKDHVNHDSPPVWVIGDDGEDYPDLYEEEDEPSPPQPSAQRTVALIEPNAFIVGSQNIVHTGAQIL